VTIELNSRRAIVLCLAVAGAALSAPASAPAQEVPDASCAGPPDGFVNSSAGGDARFAQTFVAQNTGGISRAQVLVSKSAMGTPGDYVLQIVDAIDSLGFPTNTVLASTTVPDASVSVSPLTTVEGTFATPAPVTVGDLYAVLVTRPGSDHLAVRTRSDNPCLGEGWTSGSQTGTFSQMPSSPPPGSPTPDMMFSVFVTLPSPQEPEPPPGDSNAPIATITKGPKDKTKKRTATFEFTGTDTRAIASFQCSLDGGPFTACTAPHTVKVKKGKHTFQVRAVDQAGNVGAPASDTWKRKKGKKKK
jgi:hypothetical protein